MTAKVSTEGDLRVSGVDGKQTEGERRKWWHSYFITKESLRQILMDTTMHGMRHVWNKDRAIWDRLLWFLAVSSCLAVFLLMLSWVIMDYSKYPFKTVVSSTPTDRLPFPAISICNINTLDVSQVQYNATLREIMSWSAFADFDLPASVVTTDQWTVLNMSAQTILENTDPGITGMMKACFYDNVQRDCNDLFDVTHWAMTRCYTLNVSKLHEASATTNLRVIMNINQPGYVVQEDKSVGVKFFIHPPGDSPNLRSHGSTAAPGFSTNVALQYNELNMLEYPYKSYSTVYCIKRHKIVTTDGPYYLMSCLKRKALQLAHSNCSCKAPFESGSDPNIPECTLYQMLTCVQPVLDKLIRANRYNASSQMGCPLPCDYETFTSSVTFSYFPSSEAHKLLQAAGLVNDSDIRDNILELNFYFTDLIRHTMEYVAEYSPMSMLGTIGGNLGFFLGASVVSLGEIVELVLIAIFRILRRLLFGPVD